MFLGRSAPKRFTQAFSREISGKQNVCICLCFSYLKVWVNSLVKPRICTTIFTQHLPKSFPRNCKISKSLAYANDFWILVFCHKSHHKLKFSWEFALKSSVLLLSWHPWKILQGGIKICLKGVPFWKIPSRGYMVWTIDFCKNHLTKFDGNRRP